MKSTYLHYTNQNLLLKMKTASVLGRYRGFYRQIQLLEDEMGPRVENRRVAPPMGRVSAAFAVDPRPNQGDISLVLVR